MPTTINFKELREAQGVFQKEVSERSGLTPATISRLENGLTKPDFITVIKYLEAIDLKIQIVNK